MFCLAAVNLIHINASPALLDVAGRVAFRRAALNGKVGPVCRARPNDGRRRLAAELELVRFVPIATNSTYATRK
jgi:hypothetical protein